MYLLALVAYVLCVPLANYLIAHVGIVCDPNGPCLLPVFPGILAPSGVLVIGAALLLRDLVQRRYGKTISLMCIAIGTALAFGLAPPSLAIASAGSFLLSELVDFAVYTPLQHRWFVLALLLSCTAGALVDSLLFLTLAFGNLEHLLGQFIGKLYAVLVYWVVRAYVLSVLNARLQARRARWPATVKHMQERGCSDAAIDVELAFMARLDRLASRRIRKQRGTS